MNKPYTFKKNVFDSDGNIIFLKNEKIITDRIMYYGDKTKILSIDVTSKVDRKIYTFYNKNLYEYDYMIDDCFYTTEELRELKINQLL